MSGPEWGVIVVTYESAAALPGLLRDLDRHEPDTAVIVVDNASPSGPPDAGRHELLRLHANLGYGAACNRGAQVHLERGVEYLAFLNPDIRFGASSLSELIASMSRRARVGIATGPIVDESGRRIPSAWGPTSAARALSFASGWRLHRLRKRIGRLRQGGVATSGTSMVADDLRVDGHVLGGAMVARRNCWESLGGFDETFFMFWEDADLCHRAREDGWEVRLLPCPPLVHVGGASSLGVTDEQRWHWYVDGASRFAERHLSPGRRRLLLLALRAGRLLSVRSRRN